MEKMIRWVIYIYICRKMKDSIASSKIYAQKLQIARHDGRGQMESAGANEVGAKGSGKGMDLLHNDSTSLEIGGLAWLIRKED